MRFVHAAVISFCALCAVPAFGAAETEMNFTLSATTGDKEFDVTLHSINGEAKSSLPSFYTSMSMNFGTRAGELNDLLGNKMLSPADAYMVIRLSVIIGKPVDYVLVRYNKYKKKGWGCIAKKLGVKPGSPEFHRLKTGCTVILERSRVERKHDEELRMKAVKAENVPHDNGADRHEGQGKGKGKGKK